MIPDTLSFWVIYDSPLDFPGFFVARRFELDQPTIDLIINKNLEMVRDQVIELIAKAGMSPICFAAAPQDDPKILETWF